MHLSFSSKAVGFQARSREVVMVADLQAVGLEAVVGALLRLTVESSPAYCFRGAPSVLAGCVALPPWRS